MDHEALTNAMGLAPIAARDATDDAERMLRKQLRDKAKAAAAKAVGRPFAHPKLGGGVGIITACSFRRMRRNVRSLAPEFAVRVEFQAASGNVTQTFYTTHLPPDMGD